MNKKVSFGVDYLFVTTALQIAEGNLENFDPIADAAAKLFLIQWGLTPEETDEANKLFFDKVREGSLDKTTDVLDRIINHVKKDEQAKERFITQVLALTALDYKLSDMEAAFFEVIKESFDLRPSEFEDYVKKGMNLAIGLNYLGKAYADKNQ